MNHANPARGEVEVEIDGETYVLAATFERQAKLQAALDVKGVVAIVTAIQSFDTVALAECVRCLAISGNVKKIDKAPSHMRELRKLQEAALRALAGPEDEDSKNAGSVTETAS